MPEYGISRAEGEAIKKWAETEQYYNGLLVGDGIIHDDQESCSVWSTKRGPVVIYSVERIDESPADKIDSSYRYSVSRFYKLMASIPSAYRKPFKEGEITGTTLERPGD